MKIALIGQKGIPSGAGGIEIHVEELAKRLVFLGYEVEVYCRRVYEEKEFKNREYAGIKFKYTPFINLKYMRTITHTFTSTIRALRSNCDIFHYHGLCPVLLVFIPKIFRKKTVCTVHSLDWLRYQPKGFAARILKLGEYVSAKFPDKTINVSKNLAGYYLKKYGVETEYIPNGIERPDLLKEDIIREKYGLENESYILFLSRLVPEKGAHYLIEAYKKLDTTKKLVIAGKGEYKDQYADYLRKIAALNENIIFTGFVQDRELAELYSNAYLYVLPSQVEGMSIGLLEAMSYGNCCLVSDIPENMAVISTMGYSFKKSNVDDLADRINMLLLNPDKVHWLKQFTGDYIIRKYNWDQSAVMISKIYKNLFEKRKLSIKAENKGQKSVMGFKGR